MARSREAGFSRIRGEEFTAELGEVDLLRVGGLFLVLSQNHSAREILDGFFDDVGEDAHHRDGLLFGEALGFEPLNKLEGVEVMIPLGPGGAGEEALVGGSVAGDGERRCGMGVDEEANPAGDDTGAC